MYTAYAQAADATDVANGASSEITKLLGLIVTKVPLWIAALILIVLTVLVAKITRRIVENKLAEKGIEEEHKELQVLGGRMAYFVILVLGLTISLKIAGIDLTTIIAAVAFGIGFALKDLIMNFLAGVMILLSRHFTIGDFIDIEGTVGKVMDIQSRVTILQALDGTKVVVPNGILFRKKVVSLTGNPFRRVEISLGVDYRNNLDNAIRLALKVLHNTQGVLHEPKPAVLVDSFEPQGAVLHLRGWVNSKGGFLRVKSRIMENIKNEFDAHGIRIPWPIQEAILEKDIAAEEKVMAATPQPATVPVAEDEPLTPLGGEM